MGLLNLNFIEPPKLTPDYRHPLEKMLHMYGEDIAQYAKGYFSYLVTVGGYNDQISTLSLYILVPELGTDYQVLSLDLPDVETVRLHYFTLKTEQIETEDIKVNAMQNNFTNVEPIIKKYLESHLANAAFKYLINQILLKRETRSETYDDLDE